MLKRIKYHLRTYFLTGLLVVVPIGISIFVLKFVTDKLDNLIAHLPANIHPQTYIPFPVPGLGLIITVLLILVIGIITTNVIGRYFVRLGERIVDKIPLIRSIYVLAKQVLQTVFSKDKDSFKKVVMVEYPRKGLYSIGFVTGEARGEIQENTSDKVLNIFVPTSPNPTSGYLIMIPEQDIIPLEMDVEVAFKLILSGGMVTSEGEEIEADPVTVEEKE